MKSLLKESGSLVCKTTNGFLCCLTVLGILVTLPFTCKERYTVLSLLFVTLSFTVLLHTFHVL